MPIEINNMEAGHTSELSQSCFDEVKWIEIRSLWMEKCKLSKRK